jgi:predicted AlkP superfamily pyrophosphatase or phosphodiesterase
MPLARHRNHCRIICAFLLCIFFLLSGLRPAAAARAQRPRLAVLIVFDQMRGDYLTRWQSLFGKGGFDRLFKQGTWFQNCHYPYANTVTAPGHASISTGCSPCTHGIVGNEWYDRALGKPVENIASDRYQPVPPPARQGSSKAAHGSAPDRLLAPTLGDAFKAATGGKARVFGLSLKDRSAILPAGKRADGCCWFDAQSGIFVTSTYYREKLHPWVADYNKSRAADAWFGHDWTRLRPDLDYVHHSGRDDVRAEWAGYHQGRTFPHPMTGGLKKPGTDYYQALVNSPFGNDLLLGLVKKAVVAEHLGKQDVPDLLCVSFSSNDIVGHSFGPDSQEVLDITLRSDRLLKDFLDFLDSQVGAGRYVIAVTADHGVCPLPEVARASGKDASRISPALLTTKANHFLNTRFNPRGTPGLFIESALYPWIYLNRPLLRELKLNQATVEEALARWLARQPGIQAAYPSGRLVHGSLDQDPVGERVRRSYYPGRSGDVTVVLKPYYLLLSAFTGTTHGTPHAYDTHVPLVVYGTGIRARTRTDLITPLATAVILARALGIDPPARAEVPLPEGVVIP